MVGYLVVSRPFLNLADPRHQNSTHAELLEVSRTELKKKKSRMHTSLVHLQRLYFTLGLLPKWKNVTENVPSFGQNSPSRS